MTVALLAPFAVSACSPAAEPPPTRMSLPPGRIALPDHEPCSTTTQIPCVDTGHAVFGTLHQQSGCIWLVLENGIEARIVWPYGYSARLDPFAVFDNAGKEVAHGGDELRPNGVGPQTGDPDTCGRSSFVVINDPVR